MLRFFRGTGPGTILLAMVLAVVFWIKAFAGYRVPLQSDGNMMVLYQLLHDFAGSSYLAGAVLSLVVVIVTATTLIAFNTSTFFIPERTFLPGVLYMVLVAAFPEYQALNAAIPASLLLVLAVIRIAGTYRKAGTAYNFFDAALLIGLGSLFYASLIWFGILLFAGIQIFRTFNFREVLISLLGLATPYVFLFGIFYVADFDINNLTRTISGSLFDPAANAEWSRLEVITSVFSGISLIIALGHLFSVYNTKKVKSRKVISLLVWVFMVTVAVYLIIPSAGKELIFILAAPASYFLSHYFIFMKRKRVIPEIIFSGTIILVLLNLFLDI
ncbi:MAG: lipase maturation factor family protein [Bacteroidetes bacterium]|nr:lipase maturation factor family protein [Bacteroidota bacterium]